MTATAPTPTPAPLTPAGTGGQQISGGGTNYGQLSAGPAAELATILAQLLALYETCMEDWAEQSKNSTLVQGETANASSQAQAAAGADQAAATRDQAWQSGLSGVVGLAQVGVEAGMTSSIDTQMNSEDTQLQQMSKLNESVQAKMTTGDLDIVQQEEGTDNPARDPNVEARLKEMQAGNFTKSEVNGTTDDATIEAAKGPEITKIKEQLDTQISDKYQNLSRLQGQKQQIMGYAQTFGTVANGIVGGATQAAQSYKQADQGLDQAISTTTNVASQMAGSAQGSSSSAMNKAQEEIQSAIQQFRAAAQAYPQG
ncbi:MAG: hypothetical protein JSR39_02150 [Verrucomicrobia bacterium]|nr:hypothetical protein [Verrucomicrobiota bacterium]